MRRFVLGSGLLRRGDAVLLVRCRYEGEPEPLWTLPGGRQEIGESLAATVGREFREETSLEVTLGQLAYVSESVDAESGIHVVNCTFWVGETEHERQPRPADPKVLEARFVPVADAPQLLRADVLRIPVAAALGAGQHPNYFSFCVEDIVVPFFVRRKGRDAHG
jgi:ADP-ribose pyrophosphatase YjhB (NUDIX family)